MSESLRRFEAGPDPFGRIWVVEFRWLQTAISIRHSDSIDVKFLLSSTDSTMEKVIAMMHPHLLEVCRRANRALTDPWCMKLAGMHVRRMIETWEDMDKTLVTVSAERLEEYNTAIEAVPARG